MDIQQRFIELLQSVIVLDTETTNLDYKRAEVIEFGYVLYADGEWQMVNSLHKPSSSIEPEISAVTNITDRMVADKVSFDEYYKEFDNVLEAMGDNSEITLVAHNMQYDRGVFETNYSDSLILNYPWLCTLRIAQRLFQEDESVKLFKLPYLRYRFDLDIPQDMPHHRACTDAYIAAKLFEYLVAVMVERNLLTPDEPFMDQIQNYIIQPVEYTRMTFGKHKGKKFEDLPLDYMTWMLNNSDILNEDSDSYDSDFAEAIIKEFERRGIA